VIIGLFFGILSAIKQNSVNDYISSMIGVLHIHAEFFVGILHSDFCAQLAWFSARADGYRAQFVSVLKLPWCFRVQPGLVLAAALMRYTRTPCGRLE
jgi:ABC-type dipeptide/oligopeptide/nickel transport system permease component